MTSGHVPRDGRRLRVHARIAWVGLAAAAAAFGAVCVFFDSLGTTAGTLLMALPMVTGFGLFAWGVASTLAAGKFVRFERGEPVIASWIVDADTWRERMAARRALTSGGAGNVMDKVPPAGGTEVVVTHDMIFVGASFVHRLFPNMVVQVDASSGWIKFEFETDGSVIVLQVPIGRDDRVVQRFRKHFGSA